MFVCEYFRWSTHWSVLAYIHWIIKTSHAPTLTHARTVSLFLKINFSFVMCSNMYDVWTSQTTKTLLFQLLIKHHNVNHKSATISIISDLCIVHNGFLPILLTMNIDHDRNHSNIFFDTLIQNMQIYILKSDSNESS